MGALAAFRARELIAIDSRQFLGVHAGDREACSRQRAVPLPRKWNDDTTPDEPQPAIGDRGEPGQRSLPKPFHVTCSERPVRRPPRTRKQPRRNNHHCTATLRPRRNSNSESAPSPGRVIDGRFGRARTLRVTASGGGRILLACRVSGSPGRSCRRVRTPASARRGR